MGLYHNLSIPVRRFSERFKAGTFELGNMKDWATGQRLRLPLGTRNVCTVYVYCIYKLRAFGGCTVQTFN